MKVLAVALLLVSSFGAGVAHAQSLPAASTGLVLDAAVGFAATRGNAGPTVCGCFFFYGGNGQLALTGPTGLGLVFDVAGVYSNPTNGYGHQLTLYTFTEGIRYKFHRGHKLVPYAQTLVGINHTSSNYAIDKDQNKFVLLGGGGVDYRLSEHFDVRPAEIDYQYSAIPNGQNNRQNDIRFSAGIVYRILGSR